VTSERIIDCHAHIIDPARFPFPDGPGYKPRPEETGTREAFCATLDRLGATHALLVQPSGYGVDNAAMLDAMAASRGRFRAIAMVDPGASDRALEALAGAGVVGVRFNLPSYDPHALSHPEAPRLLDRLRALGWFAQVYADDTQWAQIAPILRASRVRVLIDHFVDCLETGAPFETGPADNLETLRLVEHAYWAAGLHRPPPVRS